MRIALAQINTTVGDLAGNTALMERYARDAAERGAELVVFPELSVTGYPPRDLVEKHGFIHASEAAVVQLAEATRNLPITLIAGYVGFSQEETGNRAANRAAIIEGGRIVFRQTKVLLPTYDVFDEARNFVPGQSQEIWTTQRENIALTICEDAWNDKAFWTHRLYARDPVDELMRKGASMLISINASPFHLGKRELRTNMFRALAQMEGRGIDADQHAGAFAH